MQSRFGISDYNKPQGWTFDTQLIPSVDGIAITVTDQRGWSHYYYAEKPGFTTFEDWNGRDIPLRLVTGPGGVARSYVWIENYGSAPEYDQLRLTKQATGSAPNWTHYLDYEYNEYSLLTKIRHDAGGEIGIQYDYSAGFTKPRLGTVSRGCASCGTTERTYRYDDEGRVTKVVGAGNLTLNTFEYNSSPGIGGVLTDRLLGDDLRQIE